MLHFLQTSPLPLDSTQQGCAQSFPAALALSQQDSAKTGAAKREKAREVMLRSFANFVAPKPLAGDRRFTSDFFVCSLEKCHGFGNAALPFPRVGSCQGTILARRLLNRHVPPSASFLPVAASGRPARHPSRLAFGGSRLLFLPRRTRLKASLSN